MKLQYFRFRHEVGGSAHFTDRRNIPGFSPLISISLLFHIFTGSEETLEKAKVRILSSIFARKLILWSYDLLTCSNYIGTSSPFLKPHCHVLIPWPKSYFLYFHIAQYGREQIRQFIIGKRKHDVDRFWCELIH